MKNKLAVNLRNEHRREKQMKAIRITDSIIIMVDRSVSDEEARNRYLSKLDDRERKLRRELLYKEKSRNIFTKIAKFD